MQFEQGGGKRERARVKQTASERRREQGNKRVSQGGGYGWRRVMEVILLEKCPWDVPVAAAPTTPF